MVVAAVGQELGDRQLARRRRRQIELGLEALDLRLVAPGGDPADAVAGRQGLRKRRAQQHQPPAVIGFGGRRPNRGKAEIAVDVVLDQRHVVARQQLDQFALLLLRRQAAERVVEIVDDHAGVNRPLPQRIPQHLEAYAVARRRGDLDDVEAHRLHRVEERAVDRRSDGDGVAWFADRLQRERDRLPAPRCDDHFVRRQRAARSDHALGDLSAQPRQTGDRRRRRALARMPTNLRRQNAAELFRRQQVGVQPAEPQRRQQAVGLAQPDLVGEAPEPDRPGDDVALGGWPGRRFRRFGEAAQNVIAGLRPRLDQPQVFQSPVGLGHRIDADLHLAAERADRRDAVAGAEGAALDHRADLGGDLFVEERSLRPDPCLDIHCDGALSDEVYRHRRRCDRRSSSLRRGMQLAPAGDCSRRQSRPMPLPVPSPRRHVGRRFNSGDDNRVQRINREPGQLQIPRFDRRLWLRDGYGRRGRVAGQRPHGEPVRLLSATTSGTSCANKRSATPRSPSRRASRRPRTANASATFQSSGRAPRRCARRAAAKRAADLR